jgi:hypothetical protein
MKQTDWELAMRAAQDHHMTCVIRCGHAAQRFAAARRAGAPLDCQEAEELKRADAERSAAWASVESLRLARPAYAPDWNDGMGRRPPHLPTEVEEIETSPSSEER